MNVSDNDKTQRRISIIYFAVASVYLINEIVQFHTFIYFFGPLLMLVLMALYFFSSEKRNWIYFVALLFSFFANIFFIEMVQKPFMYGVAAYMVHRFLTVVLVFRAIKKNNTLLLIIATLPFLFSVLYIINLTKEVLSTSFYPAIIAGLLMSFLGGLSLSNFILDDNKKNSWLLISSLLFVAQYFIYGIQKYYLSNEVFQPITSMIYVISHFTFYKFVIMDEESKKEQY
jgi:hypothetical protein